MRHVVAREWLEIVHGHDWLARSFLPLKAWSGAKLAMSLHYYTIACAKKSLMYHNAPCSGPGSRLVAGGWSLPWRFQDYAVHDYRVLGGPRAGPVLRNADARLLAEIIYRPDQEIYFIITRSQKAQIDLFSGLEPGALDRLEQAVRVSDRFDLIFSNDDATLFSRKSGVVEAGS